jgi:hypothetical protein
MDLTASILAATGTRVPAEARPDGVNLLPLLEGRTPEIERTLFWRINGPAGQLAVRSGDWKLLFDASRPLLFNLRDDIGERQDLIGQHPEIAKRLRSLLSAWEQDVDAEAKRTATGDHD